MGGWEAQGMVAEAMYTIYGGAYTEGMPKEIAMTQFRYRTAPEVVADALREAIHRNEYAPGEQLHQEEIAQKFGISRIPVRDALRQLQAEGLVDLYPNRGAFVSDPSPEELREVFHLRILLETYALRLAVGRYTAEDLTRCRELLERLEQTRERAEWSRGDHAFHAALYAPCGQTRTLGLIENLRGSVNRFYFLHFSPEQNGATNDQEHRRLLAACERGDGLEAVALLEAHLMRALREVEEIQAGRGPRA
jgi:DNA-binding GntR family transcriptional regulator